MKEKQKTQNIINCNLMTEQETLSDAMMVGGPERLLFIAGETLSSALQ